MPAGQSNQIEISTFPVFHAPGSIGCTLTDVAGNRVTYFGDCCIRNGFLDFRQHLLEMAQAGCNQRHLVLLECAMVGKREFAISEEDTPEQVLREVVTGVRKRNILFVCDNPETLVYTYLYAFKLSSRFTYTDQPVNLVLSDELFRIVQRLLKPFILRKRHEADPYALSLVGESHWNFIESQRVYPLSVLNQIETSNNVVLLAGLTDVAQNSVLRSRTEKSDVILLGTLAIRQVIPEEVTNCKPRSILRVASPDWSFHSTEEDLISLVEDLASRGAEIMPFHNYGKILRKFSQRLNPECQSRVKCEDEFRFADE